VPGNPRCCCVRVCQSPVLIWGSGGAALLFHPHGGLPLQEVAAGMRVLYERVAGIDVHKKPNTHTELHDHRLNLAPGLHDCGG
jgi:hypothetical protein